MTESDQDRAAGDGRVGVADETFAGILGDRWQTSGDGIYTLVDAVASEAPDDGEPEPIDDVEPRRALPESSEHEVLRPVRRWLRRVLS